MDSELKKEDPHYYDNTVILIDGAAYHVDRRSIAFMKSIGWNVLISAPYSYAAAAIELFFAQVKSTDMNPTGLPAGKSKYPSFLDVL